MNLSAIFLQASQQQKEHAAVEGNTHLMSTLDKMKRENDSFASFDTFFTGPAANWTAGQYFTLFESQIIFFSIFEKKTGQNLDTVENNV